MRLIFTDSKAETNGFKSYMPDISGFNVAFANGMNIEFPSHAHDFYELVIILGGTGIHRINNESWIMRAGDVFVLKEDDTHSLNEPKDLELVNIAFSKNKLWAMGSDIRKLEGFHALFVIEPIYRKQHDFKSKLHLSPIDLLQVEKLTACMEKEYKMKRAASESMLEAYFIQLVITVSRFYENCSSNLSAPIFSLAKTLAYIESNYTEIKSLGELAKISNMSENHFINVFKKACNISPMNYIQRKKVDKACQLLLNRNLTITEIAHSTGFNDSNYFSRIFKKHIGKSPSEYRSKSG